MHFGADAGQAPSFRAVPPTASYRVVRGIIATQQTGAGYRIRYVLLSHQRVSDRVHQRSNCVLCRIIKSAYQNVRESVT
jgi:hypothetical protein